MICNGFPRFGHILLTCIYTHAHTHTHIIIQLNTQTHTLRYYQPWHSVTELLLLLSHLLYNRTGEELKMTKYQDPAYCIEICDKMDWNMEVKNIGIWK